ncbi:hypothetical protein [Treponema succinifaciens]|uniref:Uncharacterized protein n=1 Tax=Treponema succinifaciens (strain ATCC 33096 / DSM 2489 / 6091) TaxID=869209 RepID=F2NWF1_TRES6|nr:hypothetical protein [Treponema succinifaciens]AEB15072.1 hypothetical protein Tresu_2203 [Treponema succinifaciens DSM 2489]
MVKKIKQFAALAMACTFAASGLFAIDYKQITVKDINGVSVTIDIPSDVFSLVEGRESEINDALNKYKVDASKIREAESAVKDAYENIKDYIPTDSPFTVAENGLNDFCDDLADVIPNSQTQQNVYAEAWIGKIFPGFHFGAGVNAGVSALDVSTLKDAALALGVDDVKDINDTLVFPTITVDARLGGIILPFDIGVTAMSIDTSKMDSVDKAIDPVAIDFFTLGADIRYAIFQGGFMRPKWSVGAGFYYTKGGVDVDDDTAKASLDFKSTTFMVNTQASIKLLCLVPFIGGRALFSKTSVDWKVNADWARIIAKESDTYYEGVANALKWGILPSSFSGSSSGFSVYPQVFGGIGLDLLFLNLTVSGSYDIASKIPSAAVSVRVAW